MSYLIVFLVAFLAGGGTGAVLIGPRLGWWPPGPPARSRADCPDCALNRREDSYGGS